MRQPRIPGFFLNPKNNKLSRWEAPLPLPGGFSTPAPPKFPEERPGGIYFVEEPKNYSGFDSWESHYRRSFSRDPGSSHIQYPRPKKIKSLDLISPPGLDTPWGDLGLGQPNAGNMGLKELIGDKKFFRLAGKSREDLLKIAKRAHPHLDLSLYSHDNIIGRTAGVGPILGLLGAQKARKRGYDAIRYSEKHEYLALTNKAIMDLGKGSNGKGWLSKVISGARKISKAL